MMVPAGITGGHEGTGCSGSRGKTGASKPRSVLCETGMAGVYVKMGK
jgi:hypothetical protein